MLTVGQRTYIKHVALKDAQYVLQQLKKGPKCVCGVNVPDFKALAVLVAGRLLLLHPTNLKIKPLTSIRVIGRGD